MTKTWQETEARNADGVHNADNRGAISDRIIERCKVANDSLGPVVLASLMSTASVCTPKHTDDAQQSAESIAKLREPSVDELLGDPMMSALWRAYAINESDVRRLVADVTERLKSHGELHRRAEALVARCA
ncbi:MAG TPA: hypothetical protein VM639_18285 [Dongiaceae bacterium]|nr:hypothetical protein [Dongiaceae bacterium]